MQWTSIVGFGGGVHGFCLVLAVQQLEGQGLENSALKNGVGLWLHDKVINMNHNVRNAWWDAIDIGTSTVPIGVTWLHCIWTITIQLHSKVMYAP